MKWFSSLIICFLLISCDDFIEQDISDETVEIYVPYNGDTVLQGNIYFKWKELEGATKYHLQIVANNFNQIESFVVDSTVETTDYTVQLDEGQYEWRIKALNNGYETAYTSPYQLYVDSSSDLSNFSVNISYPADGIYTNATSMQVYWDQVSVADQYNVALKTGSDWTTGTVVESDVTTNTNYFFSTSLSEQPYYIGVNAENNYPSSTAYETRTIYVDQTSPGQPSLTAPTYESFFSTGAQVSFEWNRANDLGVVQSTQYDSLYIYSDSLQTLFLREELNATNYQATFPNTGDYFWRVKTFDEAGNSGIYSSTRKIVVQ